MYWISKISIHAPTRGATHGPCECLQLYPYFNPRSYKRSDYYDVVVDRDVDLFQSTLLQEERRRIVCPADHYSYFNPRSYKRSDRVLFFCPQIPQDFNPRSYKRSDASNNSWYIIFCIFQSTLLQEERLTFVVRTLDHFSFQSTLLQEERLVHNYQHNLLRNFNPRSYKRSDIVFFASVLESSVFQSTLLQEERPGLLCTDHRSLEFQSTLLQEERHRIHWIL